MKPRKKVDVEAAIRLLADGVPITRIAVILGVSSGGIWHAFRREGVQPPTSRERNRERRLELPLDELQRMYEAGQSVLAMSHHFGVSRSVITNRMKDLNLPRRDGREAGLLLQQRRTPEQRRAYAEAAHAAVRGTKFSDERVRRMVALQAGRLKSDAERKLFQALQDVGMCVEPAYQVDRFLVDIALVNDRVAIEVDGGNWHTSPKKRGADERKEKWLHAAGWAVLRVRMSERNAPRFQQQVAWLQKCCADPAALRQEGMLWTHRDPFYTDYGAVPGHRPGDRAPAGLVGPNEVADADLFDRNIAASGAD